MFDGAAIMLFKFVESMLAFFDFLEPLLRFLAVVVIIIVIVEFEGEGRVIQKRQLAFYFYFIFKVKFENLLMFRSIFLLSTKCLFNKSFFALHF